MEKYTNDRAASSEDIDGEADNKENGLNEEEKREEGARWKEIPIDWHGNMCGLFNNRKWKTMRETKTVSTAMKGKLSIAYVAMGPTQKVHICTQKPNRLMSWAIYSRCLWGDAGWLL